MKNFLITHPFYKKILLAAIWLILVCGIVIVLKKEISPVIAIDSLTVSYPDTTLEILPGATMEEDIAWDKSTLESIDLAFPIRMMYGRTARSKSPFSEMTLSSWNRS